MLEGTPNKRFDEQAFLRYLEKGASLRQLESKSSFLGGGQACFSPKQALCLFRYVAQRDRVWGRSLRWNLHTFFFLLFARRIKGGASEARSGLRPQWNLPELAATPGSTGRWIETLSLSQMSQGSLNTGGPPGVASLLAYPSSLGTGRKRPKGGRQGLPTSPRSLSLILATPCR